ncbi:MAG TPA: ribokinase [Trebonia sp.]
MVSHPRLTVLGSLNMDISVTVPRLPAPGATVLGGAASFAPGGKGANQAVAAARLGASVAMAGCVGNDDFGRALRAALAGEGIGADSVRTVPGVPTGIAMITVDEAGENMITVAPGANREAGPAEIAAIAAVAGDALVISAEVPVAAIGAALTAGSYRLRVLNLAPAPPEAADIVAAGVDWLVVNESEATAVLGRPVTGAGGGPGLAAAAADLARAGARNAVVTAGSAGAAYCGSAGEHFVPGFLVHPVDSVGAGDTFVGALAVALAAGVPPRDAVVAAAAAGAAAATRPGTQPGMPRPADVLALTGHRWPGTTG